MTANERDESVCRVLSESTSVPCPRQHLTEIPDVPGLQGPQRLGELGVSHPPLVDGVRVDAERVADLGSAGQIVGVESHPRQQYDAGPPCLPGFEGILDGPSEISYSGAVTNPRNLSMSGADSDEEHPSAAAARERWRSEDVPAARGAGVEGLASWRLYCGDSAEVLKQLPPSSVNCVVTSPPYYWQRDYEVDGQFGMEQTIDGYVDNIRHVFAGLRTVLAPDGVVFLNLGDTYYSAKGRPHGHDSKHRSRRLPGLRAVDGPGLGLPRKSLIGIPWRVALGLQSDGWTLRSDIIWVRNSAIPEPTAKDRPWRKFEHVFVFSRQPRYYFDREALGGEEDVWFIEPDRNSESRGAHYAPYPKALVERCILAGCPEGGVVLDPFVGGGTTMYQALDLGRDAVGIDLSPDFCSLIEKNLDRRSAEAPLIRLDTRRPNRAS